MHTILLSSHILLALVTLAASVKVAVDARRSTAARTKHDLRVMWASFISVMVSGIVLVIVTPSSLGHACALMTLYVVVVSGVQLYQKRVTSVA